MDSLCCIIFIDCLENGKTINLEYDTALLERLKVDRSTIREEKSELSQR